MYVSVMRVCMCVFPRACVFIYVCVLVQDCVQDDSSLHFTSLAEWTDRPTDRLTD